METTSTFFLLLVLFFSVSGVRATVENSEIQDDFEENNHRVDAEQEPFTKVAMSGGATSTLFRSCLESSRTFDAQFASIETPGGVTYIRYVPDSSMLALPIQWVNAVGSVSDIFGCASVAEAGGYSMFKYSANGCKLATQGYNLETVPDCEDNEEDAVFIKPVVVTESCIIPTGAATPSDGCLVFSTVKLMTRDEAISFCSEYYMVLYYPDGLLSFEAVTARFNDLGYTTNMWVGAMYVSNGLWSAAFPLQYWVGDAYPTDGSTVAYMDSQAGWKLRGAQKSALAGAACILGFG